MHEELTKIEEGMQVLSVGQPQKRKYQEPEDPFTISFTEQDLEGYSCPTKTPSLSKLRSITRMSAQYWLTRGAP